MCAGGIINARVDTVRYGTRDDKAGACGSVLNLFEERFNHHPRLYRGPLERECQESPQDFFQGILRMQGKSTTLFHLNPPSFLERSRENRLRSPLSRSRVKKCAPGGARRVRPADRRSGGR